MIRSLLKLLFVILIVAGGGLAYLYFRQPAMRPSPLITVDKSPERVARGQYLFSMSGCKDCHSETDETKFGGPLKPGRLGVGKTFPPEMGLPGTVISPNLTSDPDTGAGSWSDGDLIRAIREGIGHDGRALFPFMPYTQYSHYSDEDVQSIVAFIRTIPAVKNAPGRTKLDFPVSLLIKGSPKPVETVLAPNKTNQAAYGKYLSKVYGCQFCHTPEKNHEIDETKLLSGGHSFPFGSMLVVTPNLTPDPIPGRDCGRRSSSSKSSASTWSMPRKARPI